MWSQTRELIDVTLLKSKASYEHVQSSMISHFNLALGMEAISELSLHAQRNCEEGAAAELDE